MSKQILVNASHYETRVAFLENGEIRQLHIEREEDKNVVGNIYLGVVKRVLPGMQAAFLELGLERTAFLYVDDIIDEPFGSDVDYLEDDGQGDSSAEYADDEEPGRPRPVGEVGEGEGSDPSIRDLGPLVIDDDSEPAPIFVAPALPQAEPALEEAEAEGLEADAAEAGDEDEEEEDGDEEEEGDDFENEGPPDIEVDFHEVDESEEVAPVAEAAPKEEAAPVAKAPTEERAPLSTIGYQETPSTIPVKAGHQEGEFYGRQERQPEAAPENREPEGRGDRGPRNDLRDSQGQGQERGRGSRGGRGRNDYRRDRGPQRGPRDSQERYESRSDQGDNRPERGPRDSQERYDNRSERAPRDSQERYDTRPERAPRDSQERYDNRPERAPRDSQERYDVRDDRGPERAPQAPNDPEPRPEFQDDHDGPLPGNERPPENREGGGEGGRRPQQPRRDGERGSRGGRGGRGRNRNYRGGSGGGGDRGNDPRRQQARSEGGGQGQTEARQEDRQGRGPRRGPRGGRGGRGGPQRGRRFSRRRPRGSANIQDLLKEGQEILVQVAKAPIGTKGARLTTHISLPGRNLVLMPTVKHLGISRRISSDRERRRLRDIFTKRLQVKNIGFIIRTVADGKSFRELKADADYLVQTWIQIKKDAKAKRAPALIHEDLSLPFRAVRDFFTEEVDSFVIDNAAEYEGILKFIGPFMPRLKSRVKLFKGPSQLFEHYGIEAEISRALNKKVWLKSGGYLLVDQSEALTAIDVNTGRYVGSKSLEETIFKTNLEAVKEIAYQLRIRNVGGIIIIDLIDMESSSNREKVFNALHEALSEDKSKTNILKISELGLVEMTRKRTHEDLVRYLTEACPSCDGRGYTKSRRTVAFEIFREIEKEALSNTKNIMVFASPGVVSLLAKEENRHVGLLEKRFEKTILIKSDPEFHTEQFEVFGKH